MVHRRRLGALSEQEARLLARPRRRKSRAIGPKLKTKLGRVKRGKLGAISESELRALKPRKRRIKVSSAIPGSRKALAAARLRRPRASASTLRKRRIRRAVSFR